METTHKEFSEFYNKAVLRGFKLAREYPTLTETDLKRMLK